MIKTSIALALLIYKIAAQCTTGCLRCNNNNQCLVCDVSSNYILSGSTCSVSSQTNCNLLAQNGACVLCNPNYFLDTNSNKCVAVSSSSQIVGCNVYSNAQMCSTCAGSYYVQSGKCVSVNATVANCQVYAGNGVCGVCGSGYILSGDMANCTATPKNDNCAAYSFIGCATCNTGFVMNPNLYFVGLNSANSITRLIYSVQTGPTGKWVGLNVCQATTVANCLVFASFKECAVCANGYYLQNGTCIIFPLPTITNCQIYTSLTTCSQCLDRFFLSGNNCVSVTSISNCQSYLSSAPTTRCSLCTSSFYLQNNVCIARTQSANIANCATLNPTADNCQACNSGFILTTDNLGCLSQIMNCLNYTASTFQTSSLTCSLCANGFYLTNSGTTSSCTSGTVSNCRTYATSANTCLVCANQYYLSNGNCVAHMTLTNCVVYDPVNANTCLICNPGFYSFLYTTVCVQTTTLANCVVYAVDGNSCTQCNTGFYLTAGVCIAIPQTYANCAVFSGTTCVSCNSGFQINTVGSLQTCVRALDYITSSSLSHCTQNNVFGTGLIPTWTNLVSSVQSPITCLTCGNYMYGYSPQGSEAICVLTTQLTMYTSYTAVANCKRYGYNYAVSPVIVCMECSSGFYLSGYQTLAHTTTATNCITQCPSLTASSNAVIPNDMLGFVNICVTPTANIAFQASGSCYLYGRATSQALNVFTGAATAVFSYDFSCLQAASSNVQPPTNYLYWNQGATATAFFTFDVTTQGTPATTLIGYQTGWSNTVDKLSTNPSVFNYIGVFLAIQDTNTVIQTTNLLSNTLTNCDFVWAPGISLPKGTPFRGGLNAYDYQQPLAATTYYSCLRCAFGYRLSFTLGSSAALNPPFPSCVAMVNCASSTSVYGGLPAFLNSIFSCHSCSQTSGVTTYPTFYMDIDTVGTTVGNNAPGMYLSYTVRGIYASGGGSITQLNHGFGCMAAPTTIVSTTAGATATTWNSCAAFGVVNLLTAYANPDTAANQGDGGDVTISMTVNVCVACAANYFPAYAIGATGPTFATSVTGVVPSWVVLACIASLNCDTSFTAGFNSCARCRVDQETSTIPMYYAFQDFNVNNCYRANTQNCLILSASTFSSTSSINNCEICKAGYYLNSDLICDKYSVPNMVQTTTFAWNYYTSKFYPSGQYTTQTLAVDQVIVKISYLLSYSQKLYGASACSNGYTLAPASVWAPRLCVLSSYISQSVNSYPVTSIFVANCLRYNLTMSGSRQVCGSCISGYIPTIDGFTCVVSVSLPNCVFAQSGSNNALCYQCATNYFNVNGLCVQATVSNCASYVNTQWSFQSPVALTCAQCNSGFALSMDSLSCVAGNVTNCVTYAQGLPSQCTSCKAGFVLISLTKLYYCYPIDNSLNCAQLTNSATNSGANYGTIACSTCNTGTTFAFGARTWTPTLTSSAAASLCMAFNTVTNCASYDQNNTVITSNTFSCLTCNTGFWLNTATGACMARTVLPNFCQTYNPNADLCSECSPNYFLSTNRQSCIAYPTGIQNCVAYAGANVCSVCAAGTYLTNNVCVPSTLITNCQVYSANYTCSACKTGFFLANSTSCIIGIANNCLNFTSVTACASCAPGFGLQSFNGVTSCVQINLPNCVNSTTSFPFTCSVCAPGFFPSASGACSAVSLIISGCLVYDSSATCLACSSGLILNLARTACNSTVLTGLVDPNCNQTFAVVSPICAQCSLGYYFSNGNCTSCGSNNITSGCMACDPFNGESCILCSPNYYMNSQGACISSIITPKPTPSNKTNNTTLAHAKRPIALAFLTLVTILYT